MSSQNMHENTDVSEMLQMQLSEVEMLQSMYPGNGEFNLDDPLALPEIQASLEADNSLDLQARIGFTMNLQIDDEKTVELVCRFPHEYPSVIPEVFLRTNLPKSNHRNLSDDLHAFIETQESGELIMCSVIEWLKENVSKYYDDISNSTENHQHLSKSKRDTRFTRMWIYSHHLYSKIKRKDILDFAPELHLTGFSMPGKPGVIVIEGYSSDVDEFWYRIRRMQWKQITMKEKEDFELNDKDVDAFRKFDNFQEKHFHPRQGKGRGAHMDLGELYQFLEDHGCANVFQIFFGVDGRMKVEE